MSFTLCVLLLLAASLDLSIFSALSVLFWEEVVFVWEVVVLEEFDACEVFFACCEVLLDVYSLNELFLLVSRLVELEI